MVDASELAAMSAGLTQSLKRRVAMWAVRWLIGFGIVAAAVHLWPSASWLWWAAAGVAALSLVSLVAMHFVIQRRVAAVQSHAAALDQLAQQAAVAERRGEA